MTDKHCFSETEREQILERNKKALTKHNRKIRDIRHNLDDYQMAKELGLSIEDVKRINEDD